MHNIIFQAQRVRGLFYKPNHSEEEEDSLDIKLTIDKLPTIDIITIYATTVHRDRSMNMILNVIGPLQAN
jgi:hypothetical protein